MSDARFWGLALLAAIILGTIAVLIDCARVSRQLQLTDRRIAALGEDTSVTAEAERITRTAVS